MADPITWRSINAPDFRASASSMAGAAETFKDAFGGLRNTLKEYDAAEEKFATKRTKDNTAAYLTHLASIQDPAAAEAALKSGQLTEMLRGYGSEIDAPTAIAAQQSLLPNLQQRAVQAMQFEQEGQKMKDWRVDQTQRDTLAGFEAGIRGAKTKEEFDYFKNALGIYQGLGHLTPEKANKLTALAEVENNAEVLNTRAADKHTWESQKAEEERLLAPLRRDQIVAQTDASRASAWASRNPVVRSSGGEKQNSTVSAIQAARDAEIARGPLGDGTLEGMEGRAALRKKLVETLGLSNNAVDDVTDELYKKYPKGVKPISVKKADGTTDVEYVPIPIRTVLQAASKQPEIWGNGSWWSRRGDTTLKDLDVMFNDEELIKGIKSGLRLQREGDLQLLSRAEEAGYAIPSGKGSSPKR